MNIDKFLGNTEKEKDTPKPSRWDEVIVPEASYLLTGDMGAGKSALAYFIIERYSKKYNLRPAVVGLPKNKKHLLPDNFKFLEDIKEIASTESAIVFIDEADIQLPLDSNKDKEAVINFLSLPRQRQQIFILAYHFPRLVKGTYLPFFGGFLFKRPPYLREFASKQGSGEMKGMMDKAGERFDEMATEDEVKQNTYVVAPRIRWQGLLENELPSFWSTELSKIWSGIGVDVAENETLQTVLFNGIKEDEEGSSSMIFFNIPEERQQLINQGFVYTLRPEMRQTGQTTATCSSYYRHKTIGDVDIQFIKEVTGIDDIREYVSGSGFHKAEDWWNGAENSRFLFKVTLHEDITVTKMREEAEKTEGSCAVCGKEGTLYSGTCEECFNAWAREVLLNRQTRERRAIQRLRF